MGRKSEAADRRRNRWAWIALAIVLVATAGIRYRLLDVPLERDEGEYAYAAQRILAGGLPYGDVYNMKFPGIYAAYAVLLSLFGQTLRGIHSGLLLINAATIVLLFLLARRLSNEVGALFAAAGFALLSVSGGAQGVFANAEHFVILFALAGLLLLLRAIDSDSRAELVVSGLLLGVAVLMKQHGAAFAAVGGLHLLAHELWRGPRDLRRSVKRLGLFAAAMLAPLALTCLVLFIGGVFERFWFWTMTYGSKYASRIPLRRAIPNFMRTWPVIYAASQPLWILAGCGLVAMFLDRTLRPHRRFLLLFAFFSMLAICPGLYFRGHYYVLLLPAACLSAGLAIAALARMTSRLERPILRYGIPAFVAAACLLVPVYFQRTYLFRWTPGQIARAIHSHNPFPESLAVGEYIRRHSTPEDTVAILGSEPQILFYSGRRSATGYVYTYALMERHDLALGMQREMIAEIEAARPKFLVYVRVGMSWLRTPKSEGLLFDWFNEFRPGNYDVVGLVEIPEGKSRYYWFPYDDIPWPTEAPRWIAVLQRRD